MYFFNYRLFSVKMLLFMVLDIFKRLKKQLKNDVLKLEQ